MMLKIYKNLEKTACEGIGLKILLDKIRKFLKINRELTKYEREVLEPMYTFEILKNLNKQEKQELTRQVSEMLKEKIRELKEN